MKTRFVVPTDPVAARAWVEDFKARYGMPPIAGGELGGGIAAPPAPPAAPAATPSPIPAPAGLPAAAPAAPTPPAAPAQQPAQPAAQPGAQPQPEGQAQPVGEGAAAEPTPEWAQRLIDGMDQLAPPAQVDPLAVELGLVPAPPQPLPGQPGYDPSQAIPAAGQGPQGGLQQPPAALPGQQQAGIPGQPPQPGAGAVDPQTEVVERFIDQRAQEVAERLLQERVTPYFQQQEVSRRRSETQALLDDYPELKDPAKGQELVAQARAWAQETLGDPRYAAEPGFLEIVYLAKRGLATAGGQQQPAAVGSGEVPIEGGSGGQPQAAVPQSTELAQRIVDAKPGGGLNDLWV